jgi:alpha-tubulin suppressor-like RCC1 family protein
LRHLNELKARSRRRAGTSSPPHALRVVGLAGALVVTCASPVAAATAPASAAGSAGLKSQPSVALSRAAVAAGLYHGLALSPTGAVFAWGWDIVGQLGNGSTNGSDVPVRVRLPGGAKIIGISAGFAHSVAVTTAGAVLAWGKNYNGDLGNGSTTDSDVPVEVTLPAGTKVTAIAAGSEHTLAVTSTGAVLAWGYNADGELGDGATTNSDVPVNVKLPAGTKVTAVAAGGYYSLALTATGRVLAWGYHADGELGDGGTASSDMPVRVKLSPGTKVTSVAAGELHSLAVTSRGTVLAWGGNNFGQLGDGNYKGSDLPVKVNLP